MIDNNKLKQLLVILLICPLIHLSGCGSEALPSLSERYTIDINFTASVSDLISLAISPEAEVYAATYQGSIGRYTPAGELLEEYPGTDNWLHLNYHDGLLYGYDHLRQNVVEFDPKSKETRIIYADLPIVEIRSLTVAHGNIIMIVVPTLDGLDFSRNEDSYVDYGEKILAINIKSGKMTERKEINRPISLYQDSAGTIYVYAYSPDNDYVLLTYDTKKWKTTKVAEMNDVGYTFGFAFEDEFFVFMSHMSQINVKRMSDGLNYIGADVTPLIVGGFMTYFGNNLIFFEQQPPPEGKILFSGIRTLRLEPDTVRLLAIHGEGREAVEYRGDVVISASYNNEFFLLDEMERRSGIRGLYSSPPSNNWDKYLEYLAAILAGDDKVDIYIFGSSLEEAIAMRDKGGYVPLNDSEPINDYLNSCFDWISDTAHTTSGDIWMLPLDFHASALWYIPENFARFNLNPDDVLYLDDYLNVLAELNKIKDEHRTYAVYLTHHETHWLHQYEMTYCDYANKKAAFDTELFRNYFEKMWFGFDWYHEEFRKKPAHHPIMQYDQEFFWDHAYYWEWDQELQMEITNEFRADFDIEHVIITLKYIDSQISEAPVLSAWRVLPLPRFSDSVKYNYMNGVCAMVNPHSKNKELAIAFLEAAAQDMHTAIDRPIFLQKELSAYEGYLDMTIPVYKDIYDIYSNGAAITKISNLGRGDYLDAIADYQQGRRTLQEVTDELQRKVNIWLNE